MNCILQRSLFTQLHSSLSCATVLHMHHRTHDYCLYDSACQNAKSIPCPCLLALYLYTTDIHFTTGTLSSSHPSSTATSKAASTKTSCTVSSAGQFQRPDYHSTSPCPSGDARRRVRGLRRRGKVGLQRLHL